MSALAFELPPALEATEPPEARGVARDGVRLLVASGREGTLVHARFRELPGMLHAGDLLVVNVSATLPAAVSGRRADGAAVRLHFATRAPGLDERWRVVELRSSDGSRPVRGRAGETITVASGRAGETITVASGPAVGERDREVTVELVAPYASGSRLMLARVDGIASVPRLLARVGEPIRYGYVTAPRPLTDYQNVYATTPGSAEMPSAGRPFTAQLITALAARGVAVAPVTLHTGVSSPERHEPPFPEELVVPDATARLHRATRAGGGRVIAVGTTVVRALESAVDGAGEVRARSGWTRLVIDPDREVRAVDGLITGWHEPEASHLDMLRAIAGTELLQRSYEEALRHDYLWHEFGDSHLVLR